MINVDDIQKFLLQVLLGVLVPLEDRKGISIHKLNHPTGELDRGRISPPHL